MNLTLILGLAILWSFSLAYQVNEKESVTPKFPLQPGDLLRSLDELTSDAQVIYSPLEETSGQSADRRVYHDDNTGSNSELDYDRAYEDFVNKYFSQAEEDLNSDDEDEKDLNIDDAVPYGSSIEDDEDDESAPKKRSSKSKICERIEIGDESCLVCENPKTNEKSKSCSYSSNSKPKSYGYTRERSSKRSNGDDDGDDDDNEHSTEAAKSLKREATPKAENFKIQPRRTSITSLLPPSIVASKNDEFSKCTRKKESGMICYYCGTEADTSRECMSDENLPKKRRLHESSKKGSKTKKVFKRMVRYSYNNDGEPKIKENTYAAVRGY